MSIASNRPEPSPLCNAAPCSGEKCAWIDPARKIVSFHAIASARRFACEETDFWVCILRLISAGYRIQ